MRSFTILGSAFFIACGAWMIVLGKSSGVFVVLFFAPCLVFAILEPWISNPQVSSGYPQVSSDYRLLLTNDEIACEHPRRKREAIRWEDVDRIWYVTTSDGPWLPDEWILLEGERGGCSLPTEAAGFEGIWEELKQRFSGFDYEPLIHGGTEDAKYLCWERQRQAIG